MVLGSKQDEFFCIVRDPDGRLNRFLHELRPALAKRGRYALCIGGTETSDIEWISAAGADGLSRRLTPAIDAEALVLGKPKSANSIPVSPRGIVSPVVLSRAMLELLECNMDVFDCGVFSEPKVHYHRMGKRPASCLQTGQALPMTDVENLYAAGRRAGRKIAEEVSYVVLGECVPAGTTTALGVLTALGYDASKLVSSSMPHSIQERRIELVRKGLRNAGQLDGPLSTVAAVGDPMQPFAAGLAAEACKAVPVVLGGGTQMLAVYALAAAIEGREYFADKPIGVITTKWVAFDNGSDPGVLADLVGAPFAAACPDFHQSRHEGLRAYEEGNVKEGVAAGALMALVHLSGKTEAEIREAIDAQYELMVELTP